jgi:hypothetical protein
MSLFEGALYNREGFAVAGNGQRPDVPKSLPLITLIKKKKFPVRRPITGDLALWRLEQQLFLASGS